MGCALSFSFLLGCQVYLDFQIFGRSGDEIPYKNKNKSKQFVSKGKEKVQFGERGRSSEKVVSLRSVVPFDLRTTTECDRRRMSVDL